MSKNLNVVLALLLLVAVAFIALRSGREDPAARPVGPGGRAVGRAETTLVATTVPDGRLFKKRKGGTRVVLFQETSGTCRIGVDMGEAWDMGEVGEDGSLPVDEDGVVEVAFPPLIMLGFEMDPELYHVEEILTSIFQNEGRLRELLLRETVALAKEACRRLAREDEGIRHMARVQAAYILRFWWAFAGVPPVESIAITFAAPPVELAAGGRNYPESAEGMKAYLDRIRRPEVELNDEDRGVLLELERLPASR